MSKKQKGEILMSRLTRGGQVTIPQSIRQEFKLEEGSLIRFERRGNEVIMTPVTLVEIDGPKGSGKSKKR